MSRRRRRSKANAKGGLLPRSGRELAAAWFGFYEICGHRDCRRGKRCCHGPVPPCFTALWPLVEEREKMMFRATIQARAAGADAAAAMAAGDAEGARYDALEARLAAQAAARGIVPAESASAPPAIARVRQL